MVPLRTFILNPFKAKKSGGYTMQAFFTSTAKFWFILYPYIFLFLTLTNNLRTTVNYFE